MGSKRPSYRTLKTKKGLSNLAIALLGGFLGFLIAPPKDSLAQELSAKQIVQRMTSISDRAKDSSIQAQMILIDAEGSKIERKVDSYRMTLEGGSKSLIVFREPADVKGTALLVWSYEGKDDEQWLYLPAYGRVRRITTSGKGESFVGSDFSFSDLEERDVEEFEHQRGPDAQVLGHDCYTIESFPKDKDYPYGKIRYAIDKKTFLPVKIELFKTKDAPKPFKVGTCRDFRTIDGIPTIFFMEMANLETNHKTQLILRDVRYNVGLKEDLFTQRYLRRGGP